MPKKTKREKIISEYRRKLQAIKQSGITELPAEIKEMPSTLPINQPKNVSPTREQEISLTTATTTLNYFAEIKKDLIKTLSLATFVILLEFLMAAKLH